MDMGMDVDMDVVVNMDVEVNVDINVDVDGDMDADTITDTYIEGDKDIDIDIEFRIVPYRKLLRNYAGFREILFAEFRQIPRNLMQIPTEVRIYGSKKFRRNSYRQNFVDIVSLYTDSIPYGYQNYGKSEFNF
jgi:hypothetical protein